MTEGSPCYARWASKWLPGTIIHAVMVERVWGDTMEYTVQFADGSFAYQRYDSEVRTPEAHALCLLTD